jgi:hypothetical protein
MVLRTILPILGAAFLLGGGTARPGDAQTLDPGGTEALKPVTVYRDRTYLLTADISKRYGLTHSSTGYGFTAWEDPNAAYRQQMPFPQIIFTRTENYVKVWSSYGPGVESVTGYRLHWPWPVPEGAGIQPEQREVLWTWQPPPDIRKSYPAWAYRSGKERYAAICLYPPDYAPGWKRDPIVFYFDSLKGLQWQTALPVVTNPGIDTGGPASDSDSFLHSGEDTRIHLGITPDGERVIALVYPYPERRMTWLYVLDRDGAIVHSVVLLDRKSTS